MAECVGVDLVLHCEALSMMDDHLTLSSARNHLADALKVLLKPEIMTDTDFRASRDAALAAVRKLDDLLCQPNRD